MNKIELVGSPGVGKSTMLNKILNEFKNKKKIVVHQQEIPYQKFENKYNFFKYLFGLRKILPNKLYGPINANLLDRFVRGQLENNSIGFNMSQLIDFYYKNIHVPSEHMKRIRQFNQSAAIFDYVNNQESDGIVLFDEGLLQRGFSLGFSTIDDLIVEEYFQIVPDIDLIIYLYCSEVTLKNRLNQRDGLNSEFVQTLERSQQVSEILKNTLNIKKTNFIAINTDNSFKEQWENIEEKIMEIKN